MSVTFYLVNKVVKILRPRIGIITMSIYNIASTSKFNIFHGSTNDYIESIIENKKFNVKKRKDHWLGNGVYFFIDDASKAFWWASFAKKKWEKENKNLKNATRQEDAIIFFEITIERNNLVDLDTEDDRHRLDDFIKELQEMNIQLSDKSSKQPSKKEAFCTLIDTYVGYYDNIDAVKYTFSDDKKTYSDMDQKYGIYNNGVQLSLFNQSLLDFENCVKKKRSEWNVG